MNILLPPPEKNSSSQSSSEDEIKPTEGGLLVVRRMLGQVPKEFENQRENIFHSRCQINNKTCSLIIDMEVVLMWLAQELWTSLA